MEIRKLIDEAADRIEVSLSETKVRFGFDAVTVTSKLIDGTFPDYERHPDRQRQGAGGDDSSVFASAVDRVATISTEKSRAVKLSIDRGNLVLSATSPEAGSATEELEVSYDNSPSKSASTLAIYWTSLSRSRVTGHGSPWPTPHRQRSCVMWPILRPCMF